MVNEQEQKKASPISANSCSERVNLEKVSLCVFNALLGIYKPCIQLDLGKITNIFSNFHDITLVISAAFLRDSNRRDITISKKGGLLR